jgi:hypothetical protein
MTFILTELSDIGIIMAADSSETKEDERGQIFEEVDKIIYFPQFNIGISTWGYAIVEDMDINSWLKKEVEKFKNSIKEKDILNKYLMKLSDYLAFRLNEVLPEGKFVGLHIAGYTFSEEYEEYRPGIFHVHNHNKENIREIRRCMTEEHRTDPTKIIAERTKPILKKGEAIHIRNGIYEEFALFFPAFQGLKISFIDTIRHFYEDLIDTSNTDILKVEAESIANWVRLMCNTFSEAGIPPYIGKKIRVLAIKNNDYRKFTLDEFKEEEW